MGDGGGDAGGGRGTGGIGEAGGGGEARGKSTQDTSSGAPAWAHEASSRNGFELM